MKILEYIRDKRESGPLHFTLIDPDKQSIKKAVELAAKTKEYGTDAIMVGGSQGTQLLYRDDTIKAIKKETKLPIILFPSSCADLSKYADAVFFMSLLNSRLPQYLIEEQMKGSVLVNAYKLEPLSMAYLIVESGSTTSAGWGGDVKLLPREKPEFAVSYALAAKYFGMRFVYLEAGSGAKLTVPEEMISKVKQAIGSEMFLIVGGGIRDALTAKKIVEAGADIVVTGTIAESNFERLKDIIQAVKD